MAADDLQALVSAQQWELNAAGATQSDLDFAFSLQLQEAMAASLALLPSAAAAAPVPDVHALPPNDEDDGAELLRLQAMELERFHQERRDNEQWHQEMRRLSEDLRRCEHDERFAREIMDVPDDEWERIGDNIEKPIGKGLEGDDGLPFNLYVKGLPCEEVPTLSAIGIAICNSQGKLVLKIQKPVFGQRQGGREVLEGNALIEGLNTVILLGIKRANVHIDMVSLYNHVTGRWACKQRKVAEIVEHVHALEGRLETCRILLLPRNNLHFVIKLARDAIDTQILKGAELNGKDQLRVTCNICLEETGFSNMFTVEKCKHQFCFSCMKQHVEVKLLHGILPECPHEGCKTMLEVESTKKYLPPKLVDIMAQRVKEASIPAEDIVYCPYPKCSYLMSRRDATHVDLGSSSTFPVIDTSGARKCVKCGNIFCINCKVPWHGQISCGNYQRYHLLLRPEDAEFQELARQRLWRQCVKCNQMIELSEGCYHMTCRCGHEFCYTCGASWKNKKATCACPLWDEQYILRNPNVGNPNQQIGNPNPQIGNQNMGYPNIGNLPIGHPNVGHYIRGNYYYESDDDDY